MYILSLIKFYEPLTNSIPPQKKSLINLEGCFVGDILSLSTICPYRLTRLYIPIASRIRIRDSCDALLKIVQIPDLESN